MSPPQFVLFLFLKYCFLFSVLLGFEPGAQTVFYRLSYIPSSSCCLPVWLENSPSLSTLTQIMLPSALSVTHLSVSVS